MFKEKLTTRDLCFTGIFTALTVVMAQISIPMPMGVPMTMQTFAISLTGIMLGSRKGFYSALAYVLLGAFGLPVFANFQGGMGMIFGPTGGFILSFPLMAWLIGLGAEKMQNNKSALILGILSGTVVNYICGMALFCVATGNGIWTAFTACVLPFIPTTIIKAVAAGILGLKLKSGGRIPA